jgi:SOS-response transcriptional repressor LexA
MAGVSPSGKSFTPKQGQYLAFIHLYTRLHRQPPAETDMQQYFRVSPPSVHQMILMLERQGFIRRRPSRAASNCSLIPNNCPSYFDRGANRSNQNHCTAAPAQDSMARQARARVAGNTKTNPMPRLSGLLAPFPWGVYPRK